MRSAFNLISAYLALALLMLLLVVWILRVAAKRCKSGRLGRTDRALRRIHTPLCYAFYAIALLHGPSAPRNFLH